MYNIEKAIQKAMDQMTMYLDEKASTGIKQRKNLSIISCLTWGAATKPPEMESTLCLPPPRK